ncbi:MAG TPA: patatin-like phospholipase family protein [Gemmatimonadales bacterium]|nr:patatin-like phospholipase family protein [Gemmatimonadales bacterium]
MSKPRSSRPRPSQPRPASPPFTLVLSGGGMKGLAHVGVLQALEEHGLVPSLVVGSSIGSLIAAGWASGMPLDEMAARARRVRRRDVFQVAHVDMALRRLGAPAIYRREPLEALIAALVGERTFDDLVHPLLVNTVDIDSGMQVMWGLPGLRDVRVADAVFASCALPGIFPPRAIRGRHYVDGAVIENLPVRVAATAGPGPVLAVNLSATTTVREGTERQGFAAIYTRGLELVMQVQTEAGLRGWQGPPLVLVEPRVEDVSMFAFDRTPELLAEGRRATLEALAQVGGALQEMELGMHPRRRVRVSVDAERCIGCGLCLLRAPDTFQRTPDGKVRVTAAEQTWSPLDGALVRDCPTRAIVATDLLDPAGTAEASTAA